MSAFICAVLLSCSACMQPSEQTQERNSDELRNIFLTEANEVEITENSVIFTDAAGQLCEISAGCDNVVILSASLTTLWYEAGGTVSGCIGSPSTIELYRESVGRDITLDPGMTVVSVSAAAKNWDVESIIAMKPSLILCSAAMNGYDTIKGPASAAGIPVVCADYDDFSDYLKWYRVFTGLCSNPELWESTALPVLDDVIGLAASVPDDESVKVLSVFADSDSLAANTSNTGVGEMISLLGGINIADADHSKKSERIEINLESVYAADPDVILIQCHTDTNTAREQIENTYGSSPVWLSLRAVKEGRVYFLEKALFHSKPNSRYREAYTILFQIMYPDVSTDQ